MAKNNLYNYWTDVIKLKEMIDIVTKPVIMRYLGLQFDEMVVASLNREIENTLLNYNISVFCEVKIETKSLMRNNTVFENISKVKVNYLHEKFL